MPRLHGNAMVWYGIRLLGVDLRVGFDGDVIVGRERVDLVFGELGTSRLDVNICRGVDRSQMETYVKPLIRVNSLVILPPWSVTCFFAFSSSSLEAPDLRVTCSGYQMKDLGTARFEQRTLMAGILEVCIGRF
jgi:hypothetical protein